MDSLIFTMAASLTELSNSSTSRCRQGARSSGEPYVSGRNMAGHGSRDVGREATDSRCGCGPMAVSGSLCGETRSFVYGASPRHTAARQVCLDRSVGQLSAFAELVSRCVLYGASPRHSSIGGCRLLRWLHHCCHPVCRMFSCRSLAVLGEGTFAKIFRVTEKAIVKDLVVKKMDRILYTNLRAWTSPPTYWCWFETLWRGCRKVEAVDGRFRPEGLRGPVARLVVKEKHPSLRLDGRQRQ